MATVTGFNHKDVLGTDDATAVAAHIKEGNYTALEAAQASVARIEHVNPQLNAIAHECFDDGLLDAQRYNQGEFSGVPTVVKDNLDVSGMPSQYGTSAFTAKPAKKTDPFMQQFLAQGFTLLGKTRLPEFGFNGTTEFEDGSATCNPWNTSYSAGGSSGGAAALVASGAVPIAHGNDGGGSIRIPASACGLVGLKVTRGRFVMSDLAKKLPINLISDGVLSRSVRDTANFVAAAEQFYHNRHLPSIGRVTHITKQKLRIGVISDSLVGKGLDVDCQKAVENTAKILTDLGHDVEYIRIDLSRDFSESFLMYYGFISFANATFGKLVFDPRFDAKKLDPLSQGLRAHFIKNAMSAPRAAQMCYQVQHTFGKQLAQFDAILSPLTALAAPKLGYLSPNVPYEQLIQRLTYYAEFTVVHNMLGTPAISLPMHTSSAGIPVGVQLAATKGQEKRLLGLAFALEAAQPFQKIYS